MSGLGRRRRLALAAAACLCGCVGLLAPARAAAQDVAVAVVPDTVTVGDVFHAAVQVTLPAGARLVLPDTFPASGSVENADRRRIRVDTVGGRQRVTAIYALSAWRPGPAALPAVPLSVQGPRGDTTLMARFAPVVVASVLPRDTAGIKPQPPKGVVGGVGFPWLELLVGLLAALLLAWLAYLLVRRWRQRMAPAMPVAAPSARERALAALDRVRRLATESAELRGFYFALSAVLRQYLAEVEPVLGVEYTSWELARVVRRRMDAEPASELIRLLEALDRVKFAGEQPDGESALGDWGDVRRWIEGFPPPVSEPEPEGAGAEGAGVAA